MTTRVKEKILLNCFELHVREMKFFRERNDKMSIKVRNFNLCEWTLMCVGFIKLEKREQWAILMGGLKRV